MSLFAHVETGAALDPQENKTADEYLKRYAGELTKQWVVKQVPDGTVHGAKDNGDGTYTNPQPAPTPEPEPLPDTVTVKLTQEQVAALKIVQQIVF